MHQTANPICQACCKAMAVDRITPCAADYDMLTWRCSECAAVVIVVEARIEDRAAVDERRDVARHPVTTPATIAFNQKTIACTVHDLSATGAHLSLSGRPKLPKKFILMAAGSALPCHTVWR